MSPDPDAVRAALARILEQDPFAQAGRLSRLLTYLVERTLAGDGDTLKEYVVGIDVFDRRETFDPRLDSIVRVEVRRLRKKLEDYYNGVGRDDPVIISVPVGAYVPVFSARSVLPPVELAALDDSIPAAQAPTAPSADAVSRHWLRSLVIVAALAVALFALVAAWRQRPTQESGSSSAPAVRVAVLPFQSFSTDQEAVLLASRVTDGITSELARLGTLSVVSRTSAVRFAEGSRPLTEAARALDADFVMEGSALVERGRLHVTARLVDGARDRKVWVREFDSAPDDVADLQRQIASDAAAAVQRLRASGRPTDVAF